MTSNSSPRLSADIKPDNILVGADGRVRVVDFSVARPRGTAGVTLNCKLRLTDTETNVLVGSPAYMAPEQLRAAAADARSDQFAFCVTAYESPPFSPQIPRALFSA